jgi:ubiquinone/menaquinone biosynthesis C-methylase UbiE
MKKNNKMSEHKFKPEFLARLNNPERLKDLPPDVLFSKFQVNNPKIIFDIGAGSGFFSVQMAKYFPESKIYACDISQEMLSWMSKNIIPEYDQISLHIMEENQIPFDDCTGDVLIMINLHHELDNPELMLSECYRVLKPGGHIIIADWKKEEMPMGPPVEIRCIPEDTEIQLIKAGFMNITIDNHLEKHFVVAGEKRT